MIYPLKVKLSELKLEGFYIYTSNNCTVDDIVKPEYLSDETGVEYTAQIWPFVGI